MPRKAPTYEPIDLTPPTAPADADLLADGVLGVADAARFLGHSKRWMVDVLGNGAIPSFIAGGKRLVPRRALVAWLAKRMAESTTHRGN